MVDVEKHFFVMKHFSRYILITIVSGSYIWFHIWLANCIRVLSVLMKECVDVDLQWQQCTTMLLSKRQWLQTLCVELAHLPKGGVLKGCNPVQVFYIVGFCNSN